MAIATAEKKHTAADQISELNKQIEALEAKKRELNQAAIHEQKLRVADARKALQEQEVALAELTGRPAHEGPKARRERRASITDDALKDQLLKVLANHGGEGMNATALADKLHQDPMRIRKFIKDNPKVLKRTGAAAGTKFFLP